MPTAFEVEINSLLREDRGSSRTAARELIRRWQLDLLTEDQQIDCAQFLVAAGFFRELFQQIQRLIQKGAKIPWAQLAEAIGRIGLKPTDLEIAALIEGAENEGSIDHLVRSHQLDLYSRDLAEIREGKRARDTEKANEIKRALKDKLIFMRNNRLFDQEKEVLNELFALFPDDDEFERDRESFDLRWASEILSHSNSTSDAVTNARRLGAGLRAGLQWKTEQLPEEQLAVRDQVVEHAKEMSRTNPRLAYDLAISLHLMDFNVEALTVLELAPQSPAADWLRLELMIRARQFVNALEEATRLELAYVGKSDSMFAVVYARARALYGLGQTAMAVELLRSLVRVRPGYKNAQSLLLDWGGGDS